MELEELQKELDAQKATNADLSGQVEAMRGKMDELLTEAKKAKQAKREAEELADQEAKEKAQKAGDFEQLYKSSEEERAKYQEELETLRGKIASEKVGNTSMKLAAELAEGSNAELLSTFISKRLKYTDEGVKVVNDSGELTVSTVDDLKAEFAKDARYAALLSGSKASGGGAAGGANGNGVTKEISRGEFDALTPAKRMDFVKSGGVVTE
jgi:chromosome segregation ATPase